MAPALMGHGFAVIHPGLEEVVAAELAGFGIEGDVVPGGVRFSADAARVAMLTRAMRTPSQLLYELGSGTARSSDALGVLIRSLPWTEFLLPQAELKIEITSRASALRFKDTVSRALTAMIRDARKGAFVPDRGVRPRHVQVLQVRIVEDQVTVSLDAGGDLLHKRGWRTEAGRAPIRENLAACMLALAEWDGTDALYDPFCGAGTIPIEGALLAAGRPPFQGRGGFACDEWGKGKPVGGKPRSGGRPPPSAAPTRPPPKGTAVQMVFGSDHQAQAVATSVANARRAGVVVPFRLLDVAEIQPPAVVGTIVTNPPYGERLGVTVDEVYATFGRSLRERFGSWRVVFLAPDRRMALKVDERVERVVQFKNGGLSVGVWTYLA